MGEPTANGEKEQALAAALAELKDKPGALIPALQVAQEIYGYLPPPALEAIAKDLRLPLAKVYGVATFYAQFRLQPRGRHMVRVCLGTACHVRGGEKILERVQETLGVGDGETTPDGCFTVESVACLGACGLSPIMMVDGDTHGRLTPEAVTKILAGYK